MPNWRAITACTEHHISQEGGRCYLVTAALVLSKSEKLRKLLTPEDLQFLDRVFSVGGTDACPNPPNSLDQRYRYFYQQDQHCNVNDTRCLTSSDGGFAMTVLKAFLSKQAANQNVPERNFHEMNQSLNFGKIATYIRTHRLTVNRLVHEKGAVILNIGFPYDPPNVDEARTPITKAFGRTLRRICSYNDNIVGGYCRCVRNATRAEMKQNDKPNDVWTKGMMQNYIRTRNNNSQHQWHHNVTGPTNKITVGGTKQGLRTKLQQAAHYDGHGRRTFRHSVGFTVCNQTDEPTGVNNQTDDQTGVNNKRALPTIVICNWDRCYKGDRKTDEFRNNLLKLGQGKKPHYQITELTLILA